MNKRPAPLSEQFFSRLHSQINDPERSGFTVSPKTGREPHTGWMVAQPGAEGTFDLPGSPEYLRQHFVHNRPQIEHAGYLGGWGNEGVGYVDASRRYSPSTTGFLRAGHSMKQGHQQSIYNLGTGQTYWNQAESGRRLLDFHEGAQGQENAAIHQQWAQQRLQENAPRTNA